MGFGQTLAYLRNRSGLTQQELADALGFKSKSTVSMYESGNREPDFEILEAIADYFNVDMNFLVGSDEKKPATISDDELKEIILIFSELSPDNRPKLLELARLYLEAQRKDEGRQ